MLSRLKRWFWSKAILSLFAAVFIGSMTTVPAFAQSGYWFFGEAGESSAGTVNAVSVAVVSNWNVTAVCDSSTSNLEVIVWNGVSRVTQSRTTSPCLPNQVSIASLPLQNIFVTAIVNQYAQFQLDSWSINNGTLSHGSTKTIGTTVGGSIAGLSSDQVVTASIGLSGMQVAAWSVTGPNLTITQQGTPGTLSGAGGAAIVSTGQGYVLTASQPGGSSPKPLTVTGWHVDGNGNVTMQGSPQTLGNVYQFAVSADPAFFESYAATTVVNGSGDLEVILWTVSSSGAVLDGRGYAGQASNVAVCYPFNSQSGPGEVSGLLFTAVSGGSSDRDAELWMVGSGSPTESSYQSPGTTQISSIAAACGSDFAVTADINIDTSDLEVVQWTLSYVQIN